MKSTATPLALAALSLLSLTSAHFNLDFPAARGFDGDKLGTFPCGGQDTVSSNRTLWPLEGGQIALTMGHIDANVEGTLSPLTPSTSSSNGSLIQLY